MSFIKCHTLKARLEIKENNKDHLQYLHRIRPHTSHDIFKKYIRRNK